MGSAEKSQFNFEELLQTLKNEHPHTLVITGMLKTADTDNAIMFAHVGDCTPPPLIKRNRQRRCHPVARRSPELAVKPLVAERPKLRGRGVAVANPRSSP